MSIVSYDTELLKASSGYNCMIYYTFDDGRVQKFHPGRVADQAAADQLAIAHQPKVLASVQQSDADTAVGLGISTAYKQASLRQVIQATLEVAFNARTVFETYSLMKNISTTEMTVEQKSRFDYLKNDAAALERIKTLQDGIR